MANIKSIITKEGRECRSCGKFLERQMFAKSWKSPNGYTGVCLKCCKERSKRYFEENKKKKKVEYKVKSNYVFKERYPAPNIDEIINFIPVIHEDDGD